MPQDYFTADPSNAQQERYRHQSLQRLVVVEAGTQSDIPGPKLPDAPPFRYKFKPGRYLVLSGKVVPFLSKATLADGVNGALVDEISRKMIVNHFKTNHGRGGGILIPLDAVPRGHVPPGEPRSYLCTIEGRPGLHLSIYERVFPGSDIVEPDLQRYLEFCEHLMAEGIVPRPGAHHCRQKAEEARARGRGDEAAAWQAELARIEGEEDAARERRPEPPKPAKRRAVAEREDD